jgi:hypothetical protein
MKQQNKIYGIMTFIVLSFFNIALGQQAVDNNKAASTELNQSVSSIKGKVNELNAMNLGLSNATGHAQVDAISSKLSESIIAVKKNIDKAQQLLVKNTELAKKNDNQTETHKLNDWNDALNEALDQLRDVEYKLDKLKAYTVFDRLAIKEIAENISVSINTMSNELNKIN